MTLSLVIVAINIWFVIRVARSLKSYSAYGGALGGARDILDGACRCCDNSSAERAYQGTGRCAEPCGGMGYASALQECTNLRRRRRTTSVVPAGAIPRKASPVYRSQYNPWPVSGCTLCAPGALQVGCRSSGLGSGSSYVGNDCPRRPASIW